MMIRLWFIFSLLYGLTSASVAGKYCSVNGDKLFGDSISGLSSNELVATANPGKTLTGWFAEMSNRSHTLANTGPLDPSFRRNVILFLQECRDDMFFTLSQEKHRLRDLNGYFILYPSVGSTCRDDLNVHRIKGYFENGYLQGLSEIEYNSDPGDVFRGHFADGVSHGLSQRFRCRLGSCELYSSNNKELPVYLDEIAEYSHGQKVGPVWKFKIGGGSLFGRLDPKTGNITDMNAIYLYPDNQTGLMGEFINDEMIWAKPVKLVGFKRSSCHVLEPIVQALSEEFMQLEPSNSTHIPSPLLKDPFEEQYLEVRPSVIGSGRGVFSKRRIPEGTLVGFYQGVRTSKIEALKDKEIRKSPYKIDNDWAHPNEILDISEFYRDLNNYNATLCHLINHSPDPNSVFEEIDHPRFGKIRSVRLIKPLESQEELSLDYGFMEEYFRVKNSYQSILELGKVFSETDNDVDYYQDLKKHINFLKTKVQEIEPYADMLKSAGEMFHSVFK